MEMCQVFSFSLPVMSHTAPTNAPPITHGFAAVTLYGMNFGLYNTTPRGLYRRWLVCWHVCWLVMVACVLACVLACGSDPCVLACALTLVCWLACWHVLLACMLACGSDPCVNPCVDTC